MKPFISKENKDALAEYQEHGFVIPDFRLDSETVKEVGELHTRFVKKFPQFFDYCPSLLHYEFAFLNFARNPVILDMVEQILGSDIILWNMSFFAKPARKGRRTPWHQDGEYWPIKPLATCTVWIAIDHATTENGCLQVLPGSHKDKRLRQHDSNFSSELTLSQELRSDEYEEGSAVELTMQSGQISLHDVYLVHGSEPNLSDKPRRGMTLRYMPATSVFDRTMARELYQRFRSTGPVNHTIFLVRGEDKTGLNDFTVQPGIFESDFLSSNSD